MGNLCAPTPTNTEAAQQEIEAQQQDPHSPRPPPAKKILLLGTGESGKSTIFKQLHIIHDVPIPKKHVCEIISCVQSDLVENIKTLITKSFELYESDPIAFADCNINSNEKLATLANSCLSRSSIPHTEISTIWQSAPIQATWRHRDHFSIIDSAEYFFDNIDRICDIGYDNDEMTDEELLLAYMRSNGLITLDFKHNDDIWQVMDTGGQRNERRKWVHSYNDVSAIVFVVSLVSFNRVLWEEEHTNGMSEALSLFSKIANRSQFTNDTVFLALNKYDLFRSMIKEGKNLSTRFPDEYKGAVYDPVSGTEEDFEKAVKDSLEFVKEKFRAERSNPHGSIEFCLTSATDRESVEGLFSKVEDFILKTGGLNPFNLAIKDEMSI